MDPINGRNEMRAAASHMEDDPLPREAQALLEFWFADGTQSIAAARARNALWFGQHADFDREIEERFASLPARAAAGALHAWRDHPRSALALVLSLDQLPRNLYRGTPRAYAFDAEALAVTRVAIAAAYPQHVHPLEAVFFYLPYEHAEDLAWQAYCVPGYVGQQDRALSEFRPLFDEFIAAGREHYDVVARFGRFPHRNAILNRNSNPEEAAFLASGGKHYGQVPT
ncbi:MAG: DUF924 family protein [Gammaproteobacteria bacterium]